MLRGVKAWQILPRDLQGLAILGCQLLTFFAIQGIIVLSFYAIAGPPGDPDRLPPGLQLDPVHGVVHLAIGVVGAYVGFRRQGWALNYIRVFAVVYLTLAVLGTFTSTHLGMHLGFDENLLHWTAGALALFVGFGLAPLLSLREEAT